MAGSVGSVHDAAMVEPGTDLREALAQVLASDGDRLFRLALRVTRDPGLAEDAVQEAFTSAIENAASFRREARVSTWLHRIVYTKAVDQLRRRAREAPLDEDAAELGPEDDRLAHGPSWSRPPDEVLASAETRAALEAGLGTLTPLQRAVFELRELEGRSTEEAAQMLGLSAGATRVHLHRARLRLRAALQPRFGTSAA
jgi:RNA polymerase sigma-70 factor (ECF subfamily)